MLSEVIAYFVTDIS